MPTVPVIVPPLNWLRFIDVTRDGVIGTTSPGEVATLDLTKKLNGPGPNTAVFGGPLCQTVLNALETSGSVLVEASFDGGVSIFSRFMVEYPNWHLDQETNEVTIQNDSLWRGYGFTGVDRVIRANRPLIDILMALFDPDYAPGVPAMRGRRRLAYTFVATALNELVSEDLNDVMIDYALQILSRVIGARMGPENTFYYEESGGVSPVVYVGTPPPSSGTFTWHEGSEDETSLPLASVLPWQPDHRGVFSKFRISGGTSDHGLPLGFQITGACCFDATFVVAGRTTDEVGGLYAFDSAGNARAVSPVNLGINDLFYDMDGHAIYCTTQHGCYVGGQGGNLTGAWNLLGKYAGPCKSVCADGDTVYMVVDDVNAGINGIFGCTVGMNGSATPLFGGQEGRGHDGWSQLLSADVYTVGAAGGAVYYVLQGDPTKLYLLSDVAGGTDAEVGGGGPFAITRIVTAPTRLVRGGATGGGSIFVLTGSGAAGAFALSPDVFDPTSTTQGTPIALAGMSVASITNVVGTPAGGHLFCTDKGLISIGVQGHPDGLVGLGLSNTRIDFAAAAGVALGGGQGQGIGTVYACTGTAIYDTNSFNYESTTGTYWRSKLDEPVGPHAALLDGASQFHVDPGPHGAGWQWVPHISTSDWNTYWTYERQTPPFAPYGNLMVQSVPTAKAGELFNTLDASYLLIYLTQRIAQQFGTPVQKWTLESLAEDRNSPLIQRVRPTAGAAFHWTWPECLGVPGVSVAKNGLKVLEHRVVCDRAPFAQTYTVVANTLCDQLSTPEEIAAAIQYQLAAIMRSR